MSDPVKTAEANIARHRRDLTQQFTERLECSRDHAGLVVGHIEALILAHIQKTVAQAMGAKP